MTRLVMFGCVLVPGVLVAPPVPVKLLLGFLGSGFLAFFGVLGGSILGALLLAAVLSELPAFGFDEVLGMLLAIAGFPIVTAQLTFDDDLLTLLSQRSEALAGLTPHGHVCESSDLLAFTIPVVEEFIVSNSGGCNRSTGISFSQGWVSDQVTTDDDTIDVHSNR